VLDSQEQARFETLVLPHLDAAHNLARWLLHGGADAEDAAQEAMLRAYHFFSGFRGGDVRDRTQHLFHLDAEESSREGHGRVR
jgi:DNA-directed RNA polymerase specialized sigma24 family protein